MENYNQLGELEKPAKRPDFLTVLGILTFVNLGFEALKAVAAFISGPLTPGDVEKQMTLNVKEIATMRAQHFDGLADSMEKMIHFVQYANAHFYLENILNLLVVALGVYGVIQMFKGIRLGFHLYIISCLIRIGSFYVCAPLDAVPGVLVGYYLFTSLLFIFMYSRNLKYMK